MLLKRVPWFRLGKDQVYIGGAFPLHSVNQFFFGQFVGGTYATLGTFKNAGLRINGCEKVPQLFVLEGLLNIQQKLRLAPDVVITQSAIGRSPGQLQAVVFCAQLNGEICVHKCMKTQMLPFSIQKSLPAGSRAAIQRTAGVISLYVFFTNCGSS